jgi:hypothetical protein
MSAKGQMSAGRTADANSNLMGFTLAHFLAKFVNRWFEHVRLALGLVGVSRHSTAAATAMKCSDFEQLQVCRTIENARCTDIMYAIVPGDAELSISCAFAKPFTSIFSKAMQIFVKTLTGKKSEFNVDEEDTVCEM